MGLTGGDRLRIDHGQVWVDGKPLAENYVPQMYRDTRSYAETVIPEPLAAFMEDVAATSPFVDEDRALEHELRAMTERIATGDFLGPNAEGRP